MSKTEWLNEAQDRGLISDLCVSMEDVAECDYAAAVLVLGEPE